MSTKLLGWGSNLHGQLAQEFHTLHVPEPVIVDNADCIVGVTSTQVIYKRNGLVYLFGYMKGATMSGAPQRYMIPWNQPRAIIGQDYVEAIVDDDGYVCEGFSCKRMNDQVWRHAAMDKVGRIVAITGTLLLLLTRSRKSHYVRVVAKHEVWIR